MLHSKVYIAYFGLQLVGVGEGTRGKIKSKMWVFKSS